jgi:signal transduction histidine kinase
MTITRRLIIVLGLFFVVLASRTVFFDRSLSLLQDQSLGLLNQTLARQTIAQNMTAAAAELAMLTTSYVAAPEEELVAGMEQAGVRFAEAHTRFRANASGRSFADAASTVQRQFEDLQRQADRIVDAVDRRERIEAEGTSVELIANGQAIDAYLARFHILRTAIDGTLNSVIGPSIDVDSAMAESAIDDAIDQTRMTSFALGLGAVVVILLAAGMIERRIARPARNLAAAARTIALGGKPDPLPDQQEDELGRLTRVFNEMVRRQFESMKALEAANQEMNAQNERLRELDRLKDHFVATVSHELRTPLTSIVGYTELLADGSVGDLQPEQVQFVGVVSRNAHRLQRMVDDLLLAAKIDAGTLRLEKVVFDLRDLLAEAVESALPTAEDKGVSILFEPIESTPMVGDRTRLGQAIDNLLNNAIKFTPPKGQVEVRGVVTPSQTKIEVSDSGRGIPEGEQARVFDRFYRSSTSDSVPGTGLGLSIVSYVAQAHEGSVHVKSKPGVGSTFTMVIPRTDHLPNLLPIGA